MNRFIRSILLLIFFLTLNNCSFDNKSGLWSGKEKIAINKKEYKIIKLYKNEDIINSEVNKNLKITFKKQAQNKQELFSNNIELFNLIPHMVFEGNVKTISKYKFSKIKKYNLTEPDLIISNDFLIFYDKNGSILKFNKNTNLLWSTNIYSKKEKKNITSISFAVSNKKVFLADNLGKYYSLDLETGKLLWSKTATAPFNSQIKIKNKKLFIADLNNVLWCFLESSGEVVWNVKTQSSLMNTKKKLSIVISDNSVIFANSIGDVTKVDINTGNFIWQTPTQNTLLKSSTNFLKTSDLVMLGENIFFSNNKNQFFSLNSNLGIFNWKQNVNSYIRPIVIDNLIFTVSIEGFLVVINLDSGEIERATYILSNFKKKIRDQISFEGLIIASNKAFITTDTGHVIVCSISNGQVEQSFRIAKSSLSKPFINNNNLYIIKNDSIVVLN